jgi:hemerythrin-like domain-containing protein
LKFELGTTLAESRPMFPHSIDPESLRERLVTEHQRLEGLFQAVLAAFEADDRDGVEQHWTAFDSQIEAHMRIEEELLIPRLERHHPEAAHAILAEHRLIRARLMELDTGVDLHLVNCATAHAFIDELRQHARHEDEMLYAWSDRNLPASERRALIERLAPGTAEKCVHVVSSAGSTL